MRLVTQLLSSPLFRKRRCIESTPAAITRADGQLWDRLALILIAVLAGLVALTFQDYGITTDEYVQQIYGEKLWAFYLSGFTDRSAFHFDNLYLYGGLFDMAAVALQHVLPFEPYDTRHLLCGLVGVLGVIGTWQLARLVGGARVGFVAALLLALTASWYGAMFNNTKDIPFAVGMFWALYLICRIADKLPRPPMHIVIWFGVALGATLAVRVGALFAVFYLALALAVRAAEVGSRSGWQAALHEAASAALRLLPALVVAFAVMAVFWPWSVLSPANPLRAVAQLSGFAIPTLLDGRIYVNDLPAAYLPVYLAIKLPELTLLGFAAGTVVLLRALRRWNGEAGKLCLLAVAIALPLLYLFAFDPHLYNGIRHFFFVVPPICVLAALGLDRAIGWAHRRSPLLGLAAAAVLVVLSGREALTMRELHPHQYIYYNALVGGPGGAYRRFELDYWSNFLPQAVDELAAYLRAENKGKAPTRRYSVTICTNKQVLKAYAPPFLVPAPVWEQADFFISTTNTDCDKALAGRVIIEVAREGAVLGVVKDRRPGTTALGTSQQPQIR
ncbi:MAG TPA: glycosyltransferase family 39 protein [Rhodospirillales bacterium]|nr:glycosyltransferase family 39 protein [Rhodospirillales bacterium]